jgi:hypothetical protein
MKKAGTRLGSQILCVDSYVGIKEIFKKRGEVNETENAKKKEIERADERKLIQTEIDAVTELLNDGEFEREMKEGICAEVNKAQESNNSKTTRFDLSTCNLTKVAEKRKCQETTNSSDSYKNSKVSKQENELTPTRINTIRASNCKPSKIEHSCTEKLK